MVGLVTVGGCFFPGAGLSICDFGASRGVETAAFPLSAARKCLSILPQKRSMLGHEPFLGVAKSEEEYL